MAVRTIPGLAGMLSSLPCKLAELNKLIPQPRQLQQTLPGMQSQTECLRPTPLLLEITGVNRGMLVLERF